MEEKSDLYDYDIFRKSRICIDNYLVQFGITFEILILNIMIKLRFFYYICYHLKNIYDNKIMIRISQKHLRFVDILLKMGFIIKNEEKESFHIFNDVSDDKDNIILTTSRDILNPYIE